jgi:hypothetical protein
MTLNPKNIDLTDCRPFTESEWIGVGKVYKDPPQYVQNVKSEAFSIPNQFKKQFPDVIDLSTMK